MVSLNCYRIVTKTANDMKWMYGWLAFEVLGLKPRASSMLSKRFTTELKPPKGILEFRNAWGFGSSKYVVGSIFVNGLYLKLKSLLNIYLLKFRI